MFSVGGLGRTLLTVLIFTAFWFKDVTALHTHVQDALKYQSQGFPGGSVVKDQPASAGESESRSVMSDSLQPHGLCSLWNSLGQNTGVVSLSLLQGIFPTQGSDPGLPHCRWILYQLSHQGSLMKVSGGSYFTVLSGQQRRAAHACLDSHPLTSV